MRYIRTTYSRWSVRVGAYAAYIIQERRWQVRMRKQTFPFPPSNEDKLHTKNTRQTYTHTEACIHESLDERALLCCASGRFPFIDMINKWRDADDSTNRWNFVSSQRIPPNQLRDFIRVRKFVRVERSEF